jgi:hypothetical protein
MENARRQGDALAPRDSTYTGTQETEKTKRKVVKRVSSRRVEGKMIATVSNVLWGDTSI